MKVTANEKTATNSRMKSRIDEIRAAPFDFIKFEFNDLSAPPKNMVMLILDEHENGQVTIYVE
jgi:hypothetical protein